MSVTKGPDLVQLHCAKDESGATMMFLSANDRRQQTCDVLPYRYYQSRSANTWKLGVGMWTLELPRELPDGRFLDRDERTGIVSYQSEET